MMTTFGRFPTPLVADACVRLGLPVRAAPPAIRVTSSGSRVAGRALPARHYGSVDVFLEALADAEPGDVLVVDNGGRTDEACVGDLTVLEAASAGVVGVVVWGLHRDTADLHDIDLPVWSYGAYAPGPTRVDAREHEALLTARFGPHEVTRDDVVFADDDGVVFVAREHVDDILDAAAKIAATEREQARRMRAGVSLREQTHFDEYLARRQEDPTYTFRRHLRETGGAVEE